jgi:putative transposase
VGRARRIEVAGGFFHVVSRGNNREPIFLDDGDRDVHARTLGYAAARSRWRVVGSCQIGTHFHLLLQTPETTLASGMHLLNLLYAKRFNTRYGRINHVFGDRYRSRLIETEAHLLATLRYIAWNPVKAGVCRTPYQWTWNSFASVVGAAPRRPFLCLRSIASVLGSPLAEMPNAYRALVEDPTPLSDGEYQVLDY